MKMRNFVPFWRKSGHLLVAARALTSFAAEGGAGA
tara:strand:+ start:1014 stop:1118 length:105 start_codon:yes stop_codon:yes gene_type:complete